MFQFCNNRNTIVTINVLIIARCVPLSELHNEPIMTPEKTKALEKAIEKLLTEEGSIFDASALFAYCENMGIMTPDSTTLESAEDCYIGEYQNDTAFAYDYAEIIGLFDCLPKKGFETHPLELYFDWQFFARDLKIGGDIFENNGHYFNNR